ncbi:hypothetical protein PVAND_006979 [Polypedilum vanderplanki]|uniref:Uncharacterized protein n=1 Tax=Polypedilum vanderplanki TaxID=319348 RepID=A0A9J6C5U2_POLVA|nr:hypothetical protein PVAND_006979 [Polypedilum vanderplanki]
MILCQSAYAFSALSAYDKMQCIFHAQSDYKESCLFGYKQTICNVIKCYRTVGQACSTSPKELKFTGNECASSLMCGCDRRCNGCITVNGREICHFAEKCMPLHKRGIVLEQITTPLEKSDSYEAVPPNFENGMVNYS